MLPITKFKIQKKSSKKSNSAIFVFEPLPQGFANTLGNSLRRILYSSVPGSAVTSVKIKGVSHEYSTLAGVKDDVLSVVLKLKNLAVVSNTDEPVVLDLSVKGKKGGHKVTPKDFSKNSNIEIINDDLEITTVNEGATLDLEVTIERGVGYSLPNESARSEIGLIPVDAIFNPVKLVTMQVTNARVGQQTDLDSLALEITTDGSMDPDAALYKATDIFVDMANHLKQMSTQIVQGDLPEKYAVEMDVEEEKAEDFVQTKEPVLISSLTLSTRLTNALVNANIHDLNMLAGKVEEDVKSIKGMGEKSFNELKQILIENDINLV